MPAPQPYHAHGEDFFQCAPERWEERALGRDSFQVEWVAPTRTEPTLAIGQPAPGNPFMRIVAAQREEEGGVWVHRLTCEGIAGNEDWKSLGRVERSAEEGWDEVSLLIYTRTPNDARWRRGARLQRSGNDVLPPVGYENLWIVDRGQAWSEADGYYELQLTLRGLLTPKPAKRRINSSSESAQSQFEGLSSLSGDIYVGYPPVDSGVNATLSGTNLKVEYDSSATVVTDTLITTTEPPTEYIGRFWTPDNPPDVSYLSLIGSDIKYYFPFGWKCDGMVVEQLAGQQIWLVTITWVYQRVSTPVNS